MEKNLADQKHGSYGTKKMGKLNAPVTHISIQKMGNTRILVRAAPVFVKE